MGTTAEVERLATSTYVSLTTFKKAGTAVATPVWVSSDGDRLCPIRGTFRSTRPRQRSRYL